MENIIVKDSKTKDVIFEYPSQTKYDHIPYDYKYLTINYFSSSIYFKIDSINNDTKDLILFVSRIKKFKTFILKIINNVIRFFRIKCECGGIIKQVDMVHINNTEINVYQCNVCECRYI